MANPNANATMEPLRHGFTNVFEITGTGLSYGSGGYGMFGGVEVAEHKGPLEIISFTANPLHIKWTAESGVRYWVVTSTSLAAPSRGAVKWTSAFKDNPVTSPLVKIDGGEGLYMEKSDDGNNLTFDLADPNVPARFFRITTQDPATQNTEGDE